MSDDLLMGLMIPGAFPLEKLPEPDEPLEIPRRENAPNVQAESTSTCPPSHVPEPFEPKLPIRASTDLDDTLDTDEPDEHAATSQREAILNATCEIDGCEDGPDVVQLFCNQCQATYCQSHWGEQHLHRRATPKGQQPHEPIDRELEFRIRNCIQPVWSKKELRDKHIEDQDATWFAVEDDLSTGTPNSAKKFLRLERFERLMFEGTPGRTNAVFPSLVSFIGETGGGKSGLINLLIKGLDKGFRDYAAPVVGASQNQQQPTSGDVHLYVDPMSFGTENPKLYVDCEGLNGGDNIPQSLNAIARSRAKKLLNGIGRTIFGAEGRGREFIVSQVYSRILYTFSDVVVFVLVNTRTIENVIHQLLEWGSESVCHVSNQPVLPHAVIALNKCTDLQLDDQDNWDKAETTKWLLSALDNNLYNIPKFSKYITAWEDSRPEDSPRERATTMSLLRQFYATVTAIRFPGFHDGRGPTKLMVEQVKTLYQHIDDCCTSSRERKHRHRRCLSADQITPYFGHAFEHFTSKIGLSAPFDFVKASLKEQPVQRDFKDNIVYLACGLIQHARRSELDADAVFGAMRKTIASSILLDADRKKYLGDETQLMDIYKSFCEEAFDSIYEDYWPCKHPGCINLRHGHASGCQDKSGKIIRGRTSTDSGYESSLTTADGEVFVMGVTQGLKGLLQNRKNSGPHMEVHIQILRDFYRTHRGATCFRNQSICLGCFMNTPEYVLSCKHIICRDCAVAVGEVIEHSPRLIKTSECPLDEEHEANTFLRLQSADMGTRVLALDGGGVRGIVELVALQELEARLEGVPIASFFDIIVGTSTGGIIAAGLAKKGWSSSECATMFKKLCNSAFISTWFDSTMRWTTGIPVLEKIGRYWFPRFQTEGLENALIQAFGRNAKLFGTAHDCQSAFQPRVGLVACQSTGSPVILANYNRAEPADMSYRLIRQTNPDTDWKIWQAARASSAAPTWFASYVHESLDTSYVDGGLHHNNPVRVAWEESTLLWPRSPLDILVNVGSGSTQDAVTSQPAEQPQTQPSWWNKLKGSYELFQVAIDHISNSLNSEKIWAQFQRDHQSEGDNILRLNSLLDPPLAELHEVTKVAALEEKAQEFWRSRRESKELLDDAANRLVSRSFYFEVKHTSTMKDCFSVTGEIRSRFSSLSETREISKIGRLFDKIRTEDLSFPCFKIAQEGSRSEQTLRVKASVIGEMINSNVFSLSEGEEVAIKLDSSHSKCQVRLCLGDGEGYMISGFPRKLCKNGS
ncbi:hypothetical protein CDV31_014873 [Fusarium ambrosium]|uniref:PNPLA domain-containing protein n=1 Tax=Fusarium ambrosium TaxID=131363 RepID=A0A428STF4_9HYPO|nr:hypothetical protein CDV31_014873 [Fusarium ambrosium]